MADKILLVDDHRDTVDIVTMILSQRGYEVVAAQSGPEALAMAATNRPDLILLDAMMPGMDGFEVCRRLRADAAFAETPIIMFTALGQPDHKWIGFEAGADDYLVKPTEPSELVQRIEALLQRSKGVAPAVESPVEPADEARPADKQTIVEAADGRAGSQPKKDALLVAVAGVRGGAGATTVAINLATALADDGRPTTLVDLDMIQGHVAMYLNKGVQAGLNDLAQLDPARLAREWSHYRVAHGGDLQLMLSQPNLDGHRPTLTPEQVAMLLECLVFPGHPVIVDLGRGLAPPGLAVLRQANQVIVCFRPERLALLAARHFLKTVLGHVAEGCRVHLLMLVLPGAENPFPQAAVEEFVGQPLLATVSVSTREMAEAVNQNTPVVRLHPGSAAAAVFREAARQLVVPA